jgi:hypothetical protein
VDLAEERPDILRHQSRNRTDLTGTPAGAAYAADAAPARDPGLASRLRTRNPDVTPETSAHVVARFGSLLTRGG